MLICYVLKSAKFRIKLQISIFFVVIIEYSSCEGNGPVHELDLSWLYLLRLRMLTINTNIGSNFYTEQFSPHKHRL
jgi:hypothetical protein